MVGSVNSLLICAIGWHTAQFGFIPANLFCIAIYGFSIRAWMKNPERATIGQKLRSNSKPAKLETWLRP